jgi:hypothetical protein
MKMKAKQILLTGILTTLLCLFAASAAMAADSEFTFKGGLARANEKGVLEIYKESTVIPLVTKTADPGYYFGAIAYAQNENTCKCKVVIRIPKTRDVKVNEDQEKAQVKAKIESSGSDYTTVTSDEAACSSVYYALMQFDEGDLPGTYSIDIYIDNVLKKHFDFDVLPLPKK